jgi:hypothetical protein
LGIASSIGLVATPWQQNQCNSGVAIETEGYALQWKYQLLQDDIATV